MLFRERFCSIPVGLYAAVRRMVEVVKPLPLSLVSTNRSRIFFRSHSISKSQDEGLSLTIKDELFSLLHRPGHKICSINIGSGPVSVREYVHCSLRIEAKRRVCERTNERRVFAKVCKYTHLLLTVVHRNEDISLIRDEHVADQGTHA